MSGIFGVIDPEGVKEEEILEAAGAVPFRSRPRLVCSAQAALGLFDEPFPEESSDHHESDVVLVVDGRVDGSTSDPLSKQPGGKSAGLLAEAISVDVRHLCRVAGNFALARFDLVAGSLILARDAVGTRPLYFGGRNGRFAFGSDPEFLLCLGFGSGALDRWVISAFLRFDRIPADRTPFGGVARVPAGHWMEMTLGGAFRSGRWFIPEDVSPLYKSYEHAADDLSELLPVVVASQVRDRRAALALSSGRDSGSIAVALHKAGIAADAITFDFGNDTEPDERRDAEAIAIHEGHTWRSVRVPSSFDDEDLRLIALLQGGPIGYPAFPLPLAMARAANELDARILLDGSGGEPLFSAAPVVILDLLRMGYILRAAQAAQTYSRLWTYDYPKLAKAVIRGLAPPAVLRWRERIRRRPPWVFDIPGDAPTVSGPASARGALLASLNGFEGGAALYLGERFYRGFGLIYACPLLDLRIIRLALRLPAAARAPIPYPKPVLQKAFLEGLRTRKAVQTSYFDRLARYVRAQRPDLIDSTSLLAARSLVRVESLPRSKEESWRIESLALVPAEAWLRQEGAQHG